MPGTKPGRDAETICELWQAPAAGKALGRVLQLEAALSRLQTPVWGGRFDICGAQVLLYEVMLGYLCPNIPSLASKQKDSLLWVGVKTPDYHLNLSVFCK